jgi:hypothetical protein
VHNLGAPGQSVFSTRQFFLLNSVQKAQFKTKSPELLLNSSRSMRKSPFLLGVFLLTFSLLTFQIIQTRILSVIA